jgi:hypothetical protein
MFNWIIGQLSQPSTYRGLALLGASIGLSGEVTGALPTIGAGLVALIGLWDVVRKGRAFGSSGA